MKVNNPIAILKGMPKGVLVIIATCAIVSAILLIMKGGAQTWDDSPTYIEAWEDISQFNINILRTPSYAIFIGICKIVFGEALMLDAVVIAQIGIFLISIWYFYKISMIITSSKTISFWVTFIYAFYPSYFYYKILIMTETLSISGMVFLAYLTLKAIQCQSLKYPVWMCIFMLILLFLRPSFLFLIPIYIVGWSILFFMRKNQRKLYGTGLVGIALVTLSMVAYACAFKAQYGVFGITNVSTINNYCVCREYGILEASATDNPKLREDIEKLLIEHGRVIGEDNAIDGYGRNVEWEETFAFLFSSEGYKLTDLNELVNNSIAMHKTTYAKSIVVRLWDSRSLIIGPVRMYVFLLFVIIVFCCIVYVAIKRKTLPMISTYLLSCYVGLYLVSIIGAQDSWDRLTYPVIPCWLLLAAHFLSLFQRNPQRKLM